MNFIGEGIDINYILFKQDNKISTGLDCCSYLSAHKRCKSGTCLVILKENNLEIKLLMCMWGQVKCFPSTAKVLSLFTKPSSER